MARILVVRSPAIPRRPVALNVITGLAHDAGRYALQFLATLKRVAPAWCAAVACAHKATLTVSERARGLASARDASTVCAASGVVVRGEAYRDDRGEHGTANGLGPETGRAVGLPGRKCSTPQRFLPA